MSSFSRRMGAVAPGRGARVQSASRFALPAANMLGDWDFYTAAHYLLTGGLVETTYDQSGHSADLGQGSAGNRPAIAAGGGPDGVHDACDFALNSGAATFLTNPNIGAGAGPVTTYSAVQSPAANRYIQDGAAPDSRVIANIGGFLKIYEGGSFVCDVPAPPDGTWCVIAARFSGATSRLALVVPPSVTVVAATGDVGAGTTAGHTMSRLNGATECLNAKLARQIVYGAAHSDATMANIQAYLAWWGWLQ